MAWTLERIFPTDNDIGGSDKGELFTEANWLSLWQPISWWKSGITVTLDTPAGGDLRLSTGEVVIEGNYVNLTTGTEDVTGLSDSTNYTLWIQLTKSGGIITGVQTVAQTGTTVPANAICIAQFRRTVSTITSANYHDRRHSATVISGEYDTSNMSNDVIFGWRPRCVVVTNNAETLAATFIEIDDGAGSKTVHRITHVGSPTSDIAFQDYGFSVTASGSWDLGAAKFTAWR